MTNDQLLSSFFAPLQVNNNANANAGAGDMIQSSVAANANNNLIPSIDLNQVQILQ